MSQSAHRWRSRPADPFCYSDRDLAERYRVSRMTIWRWSRPEVGKLPPPVKIGDNSTRWMAPAVHEAEKRWLREVF